MIQDNNYKKISYKFNIIKSFSLRLSTVERRGVKILKYSDYSKLSWNSKKIIFSNSLRVLQNNINTKNSLIFIIFTETKKSMIENNKK